MVLQPTEMGGFAWGVSAPAVTAANATGMPSSPAHPCCSKTAPELWEMLGVLPAVSPSAGMGMHGAARLLGFFWGIPGGAGPPLLHPWGLVPSQGEDVMIPTPRRPHLSFGGVTEPRGAAAPGEDGDAGTWPRGWRWQLG